MFHIPHLVLSAGTLHADNRQERKVFEQNEGDKQETKKDNDDDDDQSSINRNENPNGNLNGNVEGKEFTPSNDASSKTLPDIDIDVDVDVEGETDGNNYYDVCLSVNRGYYSDFTDTPGIAHYCEVCDLSMDPLLSLLILYLEMVFIFCPLWSTAHVVYGE